MLGCLSVHTESIGEGIIVACYRVGGGLKVSCGLVCSVNAARILKVEPKHIFLMEANGYIEEVCVISNVEWHIDNN